MNWWYLVSLLGFEKDHYLQYSMIICRSTKLEQMKWLLSSVASVGCWSCISDSLSLSTRNKETFDFDFKTSRFYSEDYANLSLLKRQNLRGTDIDILRWMLSETTTSALFCRVFVRNRDKNVQWKMNFSYQIYQSNDNLSDFEKDQLSSQVFLPSWLQILAACCRSLVIPDIRRMKSLCENEH